MPNQQEREPTIYDLANRIGVSAATVSRALNGNPAISKKTRKKVSELAREMGYRQNSFAKNLRNERSYTIGVVIHELNSHFIISVLSGIEQVVAESNYNIIIAHSEEKKSKEVANVANLFHKRIDGLIASLAYDTEELSHYNVFIQKKIPIVFFDRVKMDGPGIKVIIDNEKAGYDATRHLIEQGCKNIVHVTGNLKQNVYADRLKGFQRALSEDQIDFNPDQLFITDLSEKAGIEVAEQIFEMRRRPDGVFITKDLCAAVCMQRLKEGGIAIPDEIAVVGFNNDIISRIVEPQLTTVQYNGWEMGRLVATSLLEPLNTNLEAPSDYTTILRHELIIRSSSMRKDSTLVLEIRSKNHDH